MLACEHFWPSQLESSMEGRKMPVLPPADLNEDAYHISLLFPPQLLTQFWGAWFVYNIVPLFCQLPQATLKKFLKSINSRIIILLESNLWRSFTCSKQVELQICIRIRLLWTLPSWKPPWTEILQSIQALGAVVTHSHASRHYLHVLLKFPFLQLVTIDSSFTVHLWGKSGSIISMIYCLKMVKYSNCVLP